MARDGCGRKEGVGCHAVPMGCGGGVVVIGSRGPGSTAHITEGTRSSRGTSSQMELANETVRVDQLIGGGLQEVEIHVPGNDT